MADASITLPAPRRVGLLARWETTPFHLICAGTVAAFLAAFLIAPVATVVFVAFWDGQSLTLVHFADFFRTSLMIEATWNSIYVALMAVIVATIIAVPLAYFTVRFRFKGAALIQTLGVIPLVMPPFVGAVAMQLVYGRNGSVNLLLMDWFGFRFPFMEGLNGVIFVQGLHYFPFILLNLSASLANIDSAMEESAQNLGASGWTLFSKIVFPLAMPGYIAGAALVFAKVFDDLATPLLLNVNNMLAPQAYLRITSVGLADPMGYVISTILVVLSVVAVWLSLLSLKNRDFATTQRGGGGLSKRELRTWEKIGAYVFIAVALILALSPHFGILMLSLATVWSFSVIPDAFTFAHYITVFRDAGGMMANTVLYCGVAALIDVVLGTMIAYLVLRTKLPFRQLIDQIAMAAVAVPGLVLGIGILRVYFDVKLPFSGESLATFWVMLAIAYAVRRLPYALRSCTAALQQLHRSLEEAAECLGGDKSVVMRKIVVPLMAGGILAGFVTSFATAAVELASTLLLVTRDASAPLSYGIYVYMQSAAGRGPGAALGVIAVVVVAIATWAAYRVAENDRARRAREGVAA